MRLRSEEMILLAVLVLVSLGTVMVYSASGILSQLRQGDGFFYLKRQLLHLLLGMGTLLFSIKLNPRGWAKLAYPFMALSLTLLLLVLLPSVGVQKGVARRWLATPLFSFQPSELAKLASVIFMAYILARKGERIRENPWKVAPLLMGVGGAVALILLEPDVGTALFLCLLVTMMLFLGGSRLSQLILVPVAISPALAVFLLRKGYVMERIEEFMGSLADPTRIGYQLEQSLIAFSRGGSFGVGLGAGKQKLFYLPAAHTDFILSIIGEELGLVGVGLIILLFALILICGFRIAMRTPDPFLRYLASGMTLMIVVQGVINMGVVLGLLPTKGIPLPFLSYGGTSLLINMAAAGVLVRVGREGG